MSDETRAASSVWPLRGVQLTGLFGVRSFALQLDESTTIITGENGSGKSTALRAIHLLSSGQWGHFHDLPLESIALHFADGSHLSATNAESTVVIAGRGDPWTVDLQGFDVPDPRRRREAMVLRHEIDSRVLAGRPTT